MHAIKTPVASLHLFISISLCADMHAQGAGMGTAQVWLRWSRVVEPSAWHVMQKCMAHQEGLMESKKVGELIT